jgi:hypothetical protein
VGTDEIDPPSVSDVLGGAVESALQAAITRTNIANGMAINRGLQIMRNTLIMIEYGQ